jgi:hypothetical protein
VSTGSTHLRLEVISGNACGDTIVVGDELVIGRHATGAGRLSEDDEISRQHARISREVTGDYAIEDLGSSNGTFVNGLRVQSSRLLSVGDSIETGATTLVVRDIVRPEPEPAAEPAAPRFAAPASPAADSAAADPRRAPTVFARSPVAQPQSAALEPASAAPASAAPGPESAALEPASAAPGPASAAPKPTPPLALELEIDFDAREARVALGSGQETLHMVLKDGSWRAGPGEPQADR